ncbi:MAG: LysR family transcriptional regulator [Gemmatimonadetes bacterium]|nr:LysR family transcriptional regulator [Gemmatimonadota bacterium]
MIATRIDLQLLATFVAVAEDASFSKAARKLGVVMGTVSRAIARLEKLVGAELLHRTTHQVALSTAGTALYERAAPHVAGARRAVLDLPERDEQPSGLLRMTAPHDFGAIVLPALLASFALRHPAVRFDVRLTGNPTDLVREGLDLAICVASGSLADSTLTARRLGQNSSGVYAAPSYLARRGRPRRLGEEGHEWVLHAGALRVLKLRPEMARFLVDDFFLARDLLRDGAGVGLLPDFVASRHLRDGLLEEVGLADFRPPAGPLVLLYPSSGQVPRKVAAFRDHLVHALKRGP